MPVNIPKNREDDLVRMASQRLGIAPDALKKDLASGRLDALTAKLSPQETAQINAVLKDPKAIEAFLRNPQVAALLSGLMKAGQ